MNLKDYTPAQLDAWASKNINNDKWNKSLSENYTIVVESDGVIIGFGDLDDKGYFNRLFVHKNFQRRGIARLIECEIEKYAKAKNITLITTEASITAKPFFEQCGYRVIKQQNIERGGQILINFLMKKKIHKANYLP